VNEGVGIASVEHTARACHGSIVKGGGTAAACGGAEGGGASNKSEGNDLHDALST